METDEVELFKRLVKEELLDEPSFKVLELYYLLLTGFASGGSLEAQLLLLRPLLNTNC